ncbi:MAG: RHS repeat domain-containing protein [Cellulosilyticaceae bacterium]
MCEIHSIILKVDNIAHKILAYQNFCYNYNPLNQQIKVTLPDGNSLVNHYDAEGLCAEIEENNCLIKFIFHQDTIIAELDTEDTIKARLVRGHGIVAANINGMDNNYYYHQDEQGSTAIITDENADIKNSYHYDAFGKILESQETLPNRITYTGQQYDPLTQQYYLRARYYNPIIGRFTQEDIYRGDGLVCMPIVVTTL